MMILKWARYFLRVIVVVWAVILGGIVAVCLAEALC